MSLQLQNVSKSYGSIEILRNLNLELGAGSSIAILGPSGSGKSTLLHLMGTLDSPTVGTIHIEGKDPSQMREKDLAAFRNTTIGFVFQDAYLLPQFSVFENVMIPSYAISKRDLNTIASRASELLTRVGLSHRLHHRSTELSGGERQRAAIARALLLNPKLLLCDEPTGNLDHANAQSVAQLLAEIHKELRNVLVVVTHNLELASLFERRSLLQDGVLKDS